MTCAMVNMDVTRSMGNYAFYTIFDLTGIMAPVDRYGDVFEDLLTCIKSIRFTDQYIALSQRTSLPMSPQAVITENEEFITKVHLAVLQKVVG